MVTRIVPCAEMVRFLLSGTEATMLAMRLSRAHTGRDVVVKIHGHFHGWHDYAMIGFMPPFDVPRYPSLSEPICRNAARLRSRCPGLHLGLEPTGH